MTNRLNENERKELIRIFKENGYNVTDIETLSFELEEQGSQYIGEKDDIIDQFMEIHCVQFSRVYLDEEYICKEDEDWEELSNKKYLNVFRLFEESNDEIERLRLKKECIEIE